MAEVQIGLDPHQTEQPAVFLGHQHGVARAGQAAFGFGSIWRMVGPQLVE